MAIYDVIMIDFQGGAKGEGGGISWASSLLPGPALHGQATAALFGETTLTKTKDKRQIDKLSKDKRPAVHGQEWGCLGESD